MADSVLVKIWHGGKLRTKPKIKFVGGEPMLIQIEVDKMSYFELADYVMDTGSYKMKDFRMYYLLPGKRLQNGLILLKNDADVNEMMKILGDDIKHMLHLYVQASEDVVADEAGQITPIKAHQKAQLSPIENPNVPTVPTTSQKKYTKLSVRRLPNKSPTTTTVEQELVSQTEEHEEHEEHEDFVSPTQVLTSDATTETDDGEDTDDDASEKEVFREDGEDTDDDEWKQSLANWKKEIKQQEEATKQVITNVLAAEGTSHVADECAHELSPTSSYEDSDAYVNSPGESEDDDIRGKKNKLPVPTIDEYTDWSKWSWVVGTRFPTREAFKEAVRKYAVAKGRDLKISVSNKNRQGRVGASCVGRCPFKVYCSFHVGKCCFIVRSVRSKHTCQRSMTKNRQLTAEFVANEFLPIFKTKPHWSAKEIQGAIQERFKVFTNKWLAYNAKRCAHKKLHGSMKDHYCKLGSYIQALKEANPTSTFVLMTVPAAYYGKDTETDVFFRMFVCFDGVKRGFLDGCRRLLCLDGCFLKTFLGGMLLAAIGRDANDQMFPVAWAVVEGENNDSWGWFMSELKKVLNVTDDGKGWTLISDQQKGLLNAVVLHWEKAEHRNCARHIYANWHKKFKGEELKACFWKAVRAYCEADYVKAIEELRELNAEAADAFIEQNPKVFCRAFLNLTNKADVVVNNMAETFNGYIIQSRSKHLINMLEDIRVAIMSRLIRMKTQMSAKEVTVCPRIQQKLDKEKNRAYKCEIFPSSSTLYQVRSYDDVSVDISKCSCTCRKWDLTGIPCYHACAVIGFLSKHAEDFVDKCYMKDMYLKAYQFTIPPLASDKFWPKINSPLEPPPIKVQPGRPKKNRKKDPHELPKKPGKLSKHGSTVTCGNCKQKGHNKRKCPMKGKEQPSSGNAPKRGRGRPRKQQATEGTQQSQVTQES